ncbi:hypothetical protein OAK75_04320 [Bacteriovoracales bacterium]|nr:hypothetical protein [Bacteriovoracales bacterium]
MKLKALFSLFVLVGCSNQTCFENKGKKICLVGKDHLIAVVEYYPKGEKVIIVPEANRYFVIPPDSGPLQSKPLDKKGEKILNDELREWEDKTPKDT